MEQVIVLNSDFTFLNTICWQDAVTLVWLEKADVVKESDRILRNSDRSYEIFYPLVLRLRNMVTKIFKPRTGYNRRNVFFRDDFKCQYCGIAAEHAKMTIDHVNPRAQGGKTSYENCVTACEECNQFKADRTPEQANMKLLSVPKKPNLSNYFRQKMKNLKIDDRLRDLGVYG